MSVWDMMASRYSGRTLSMKNWNLFKKTNTFQPELNFSFLILLWAQTGISSNNRLSKISTTFFLLLTSQDFYMCRRSKALHLHYIIMVEIGIPSPDCILQCLWQGEGQYFPPPVQSPAYTWGLTKMYFCGEPTACSAVCSTKSGPAVSH